jgi:hypothetical protein
MSHGQRSRDTRWHPPPVDAERDIAVLWAEGEVRCILSWSDNRYRVRLVNGSRLIRNDFETDEKTALAVGRRWRLDTRPRDAESSPRE